MLKANVVSRVLKAAGHKRSEAHTTRVPGQVIVNVTAGFEVEQWGCFVLVHYRSGLYGLENRAQSNQELSQYATTLRKKGYTVAEIRSEFDSDHVLYLRALDYDDYLRIYKEYDDA